MRASTVRRRSVNVDLWDDGSHVHLTVHDDGRGFDPTVRTQGFGLTGIRERVELLQGGARRSPPPLERAPRSVSRCQVGERPRQRQPTQSRSERVPVC